MRRLIAVLFAGALILMVLSFGGSIHGVGDSLAVFRYWIALFAACLSVLLLSGRLRRLAIAIALMGFAAVPIAARVSHGSGEQVYRYSHYQKNLLYSNQQHQSVIDDVRSVDPDFVTLQEIWYRNMPIIDALKNDFAAVQTCKASAVGDIAVLSKWPKIEGTEICRPGQGFTAMQVTTPDGPLWVGAIHLTWPYPYGQPAQVKWVLYSMQQLDGPALLGGDFNMVPWSYAVHAIEDVSGTKRAGPILRTYVGGSPLLQLPIDHILVTGGKGVLQTRPLLGSDHKGLVLQFNLQPAPIKAGSNG